MSWSVRHVRTNALGEILVNEPFTNIIGNFNMDLERGDQFVIKCSDLTVEHDLPLPMTPHGWEFDFLIFYWNGDLVEAFYFTAEYSKLNERTQRYSSQLFSLQQMFFKDLKTVHVRDYLISENDNWWSNNFTFDDAGAVQLLSIWSNSASYSHTNRWAFSINDVLQSMNGANSKGYYVNQVSTPGPVLADGHHVPVLYCRYSSTDLETAKDMAFGSIIEPVMTWHDLFRYASIFYNATIEARPVIMPHPTAGFALTLDVTITPRSDTLGTVLPVQWYGRERVKNYYGMRQLTIKSTARLKNGYPAYNYQLVTGFPAQNDLVHELPIYDTRKDSISGFDDAYLLAVIPVGLQIGNWVPYLDDNEMQQFITGAYMEDRYLPFFGVSDGHIGKIRYDGQTIMSVLEAEDQIQVFRLNISRDAAKGITMAKAEGPRL